MENSDQSVQQKEKKFTWKKIWGKIWERIMSGMIVPVIVLIALLVFGIFLWENSMIPTRLFFQAEGILLLFTILIAFLTYDAKKKVRFTIGFFLALLTIVGMVYISVGIGRINGTLKNIYTNKVVVGQIGIYVLKEDPANTLEELENCSFGILSEMDRNNTDIVINHMNIDLKMQIETEEYSELSALINALILHECRAIIMNSAYLDVLMDIEEYENIEDLMREIDVFEVKKEITRTAEADTQDEESEDVKSENAFLIYISGIDSRNGLIALSRSDANILAAVNMDNHQLLLISTPRDYFIPLSNSNGEKDKLTHAGIYGVDVAIATMEMLYEVDIDYYIRINFEGFEELVDALGGVTVYSEYAFRTSDPVCYFEVGYNEMNGKETLAFVRNRSSFSSGDRQRGKNQLAVIEALINKIISPRILVNYHSLLDIVEKNFETNIPSEKIAAMVNDQLRNPTEWEIFTYSVDGTGAYEVPYSIGATAYVMIPDETTVETAKGAIKAICREH